MILSFSVLYLTNPCRKEICRYTYAEFDLDFGNPLQDLVGFFVHVGELLDGKPTNHLDMRKPLAKTKAAQFLDHAVTPA